MLFTRIYQLIQVLTLSVGLCSLVLIVIAPVPETIPRRGRAQRHVARYRSGLKAGIGWEKRAEYAEEVKELWTWGFHQYMTWAYPADVLKPITCKGESRDLNNPSNYAVNDVNGNFSVTHVDVLSTIPIFLGENRFIEAIDRVIKDTVFDQDVKIQVFEVTIRVLGSLLSSYQQLTEIEARQHAQTAASPHRHSRRSQLRFLGMTLSYGMPSIIADERAQLKRRNSSENVDHAIEPYLPSERARALLALAHDLGERLLPAFETATGVPYSRVNLRHGVEEGEGEATCAAAGGTLVLEYALLSRLTGDPRFEDAARKSFSAIWTRRSPLNLIGNEMNVQKGIWLNPGASTIGAGVDSFFEYALKAGIVLDDDQFADVWEDAYAAIMQVLRSPDGYMYRSVHFRLGTPLYNYVDSLSAFWPGTQVLAGDIAEAIKSHLFYWNLWRKYSAMPEAFNFVNRTTEWNGYPLRPEFVESTYYLYRATKDPFYLDVGARILRDLKKRTQTQCGFAVIHDVLTGKLEDRMESFVLSETLKYLFLLFDESSATHAAVADGKVFTTEGHLVRLPSDLRRRPELSKAAQRRRDFSGANYQCLPYRPQTLGGLVIGVRQRNDYDYAAMLVDMPLVAESDGFDAGTCSLPAPSPYHFEMSMSGNNSHTADPAQQIRRVDGAVVIDDVRGLQARVTRNQDGSGLRISSVGPYRVRPGQTVILAESSVSRRFPVSSRPHDEAANAADARAMLEDAIEHAVRPIEAIVRAWTTADGESDLVLESIATTGLFGRPISRTSDNDGDSSSSSPPAPLLPVARPLDDGGLGCHGAFYTPDSTPFVAIVRRGGCTFFEKLLVASQHGASAAIITGDDDQGLRPSADEGEPLHLLGDASLLYVPKTAGDILHQYLDVGQSLLVSAEPSPQSTNEDLTALLERLAHLEQQFIPEAAPTPRDYDNDEKPRDDSAPTFSIGGLPIVNLYME